MKFSVVLAILLILAFTNPGLDAFVDWAVDELVAEHAQTELGEALGAAVAGPLLHNITSRSNYGVLSVFTVQGINEEHRYIGVARQFFALDDKVIDVEGLEE